MLKIKGMFVTPYHGWLDRLGAYLYERTITKAIKRGDSIGDYFIVPEGYRASVIQKKPQPGTADPLEFVETVGWKFVKVR